MNQCCNKNDICFFLIVSLKYLDRNSKNGLVQSNLYKVACETEGTGLPVDSKISVVELLELSELAILH